MRNRVVLITGASSGIGAALARRLADSSRLVLVARRRQRLEELGDWIAEQGGQAEVIEADLADENSPAAVVAQAVERFGGLDAVVNNAGAFITREADRVDAAHIDRLFQLNVRAPMLLTAAAVPHLAENGGGNVVNISSVASTETFTDCSVYSATKAALDCWARILREELRPRGIRVGTVAPGATDTEAWGDADIPRDRLCRAEDVAAAAHFLLDQAASASVDRLVVTPPTGKL
jgi:short-subunit dehydrogenase